MGALGKWYRCGPTCGSGDSAFTCAHAMGCCVVPGLGGEIEHVGSAQDRNCLSYTRLAYHGHLNHRFPAFSPSNSGRAQMCLAGGVYVCRAQNR